MAKSTGSLNRPLKLGQSSPLKLGQCGSQGYSRLSLTSDRSQLSSRSTTHPTTEHLGRRGHVPYRNCMLTMVLKDSLGEKIELMFDPSIPLAL